MSILRGLRHLHDGFFGSAERLAGGWLLQLAARLAFAAVLFLYFFNSWKTKTGDGLAGLLSVSDGAYYQIVPWAVEAAGGEISQVGLLSHLIVHAGTMAELLLPAMVVAGLFTRIAALGMICFVAVQSWVDLRFHGVSGDTAGALFDRFPDSLVADQRTLWAFLLLVLAVKGGGALSLDAALGRWFGVASRAATAPA